MKNEYLASLLRLEHEVFTFKELLLIWGETDINLTKKRVYRYVKAGKLHTIRKGIYAKDKNFDRMEFANKIFTPSYISLETVLTREGIVFQHYNGIFVLSYLSREISCGGQKYIFRKIKYPILTNSLGIEKKNNYFIASRERAFLDTIYLSKNYYFDNLSLIDWNKCFDMIQIYKNGAMEKRLNSYHKQAEHV